MKTKEKILPLYKPLTRERLLIIIEEMGKIREELLEHEICATNKGLKNLSRDLEMARASFRVGDLALISALERLENKQE